ncbi:MAG: head maturation protease, ClpP-related [Candidatus Competibacteraceae bacterium]
MSPYCKIEARSNTATLRIYDAIGDDPLTVSQTTRDLISQLDGLQGRQITIYINSHGGSLFDGIAIYNAVKRQQLPVTIIIDGWALSAASLIAMAGAPVLMGQGAMMMLHNPKIDIAGDAKELRSRADLLDTMRQQMAQIYGAKTGASEITVTAWMEAETWFDGPAAINAHLADALTEEACISAVAPSAVYKAPKGFSLDTTRLSQHYRIAAHAQSKGIPYVQALQNLRIT